MDSLCNMSEFTKSAMLAKSNGEKPYKVVIDDLVRKAEEIENRRLEKMRVSEVQKSTKTVDDEGR